MDSSQPKVYGGEISVGLEPESFPVGFSTNIYPVAQCSILDLCLEMDSSQPKIYGGEIFMELEYEYPSP